MEKYKIPLRGFSNFKTNCTNVKRAMEKYSNRNCAALAVKIMEKFDIFEAYNHRRRHNLCNENFYWILWAK